MGERSGINLYGEFCGDLCRDGVTSTLNSRYRLTQYNLLHQLYFTPYKLHKYNSDILPLCLRCGLDEGTFPHSTWHCPKLWGFWQAVCDTLSSIHGVVFPMDGEICLLGNLANLKIIMLLKLAEILLVIAKKCIASTWKSDIPLPIGMWLSEINSFIPLEKITYWSRNKSKAFYKIWQPSWITWKTSHCTRLIIPLPLSLSVLSFFGWWHYIVVSANNFCLIFLFISVLLIVCCLVDFVLLSVGCILFVNVPSSGKAK